jgi:cysteinyl-tRNA synthetase
MLGRRLATAAAAATARRRGASAAAAASPSPSSLPFWRCPPSLLLTTTTRLHATGAATTAAASSPSAKGGRGGGKKATGEQQQQPPAAAATTPAAPAAGDYAALRRLAQLHNTMSRAKEPFVPASILPSRPLEQRRAAGQQQQRPLITPDGRTAPQPASSLLAAAHSAFDAYEQGHPPTNATQAEDRPKVTMYVCGVTVYDLSHIGHARAYVAFDCLVRLLSKAMRYDVRYVRNFTDVDDKIIARAAKVKAEQAGLAGGGGGSGDGSSSNGNGNGNCAPTTNPTTITSVTADDALALASRFIDEFRADMQALHCLPPTDEPRATEHIAAMVETIRRIVANGHAYATADGSGDVFFDVRSLPGYGSLSGRTDASVNRAGASERVAVDSRKRDAADFALWKATRAGEPSWPSPWGPGRPGWHIECSAMIREVLGEQPIDIHGGGRDLVFPHHENELAQSRAALAPCACCGGGDEGSGASPQGPSSSTPPEYREFARYWVHNGFVNVDSEKMSKSLGNFFTIRDACRSHGALALRWLLVSAHYRQPLHYTSRALDESADRLYYVYQALEDADAALSEAGARAAAASAEAEERTPPPAAAEPPPPPPKKQKGADNAAAGPPPPTQAQALAGVLAGDGPGGLLASTASAALADDLGTPAAVGALSPALKALNDLLHTKAGRKTPGRSALIASYRASLSYVLGDLLGFPTDDPSAALLGLREAALRRAGVTEQELAARVEARAQARAAKDFAAADAVRAELAAKGIYLMDAASGGGSAWRPGIPEEQVGDGVAV